ncbi:MAG: Tex family protein [Candidatus Onthovivens sp.]|nr:Tex family protein [Candidatus Onthovivens sp.]
MNIIKRLEEDLNLDGKRIEAAIKLIDEGNTIPFIARYRKEVTGNMNDDELRRLFERLTYLRSLEERMNTVISSIEEQGKMTDELKNQIDKVKTLSELEDIYRPYKPKKKTRGSIAKEKGLEPLAKFILEENTSINLYEKAKEFICPDKGVNSIDDAINYAKDIIAEIISDDPEIRKLIKEEINEKGRISSKEVKTDEKNTYEMYKDYSESVKSIPPHRILALNRGENEKCLKITIDYNEDKIIGCILNKYSHKKSFFEIYESIVNDSFKRLIKPSVENEIRNELFERASEKSFEVFKKNLKSLLMYPPLKGKDILGFDPGFRTGCKYALIDKLGNPNMKVIGVSYITANSKEQIERSKAELVTLFKKHHIDYIALGNGTASRESEEVLSSIIKENNLNIKIYIVNESGASVYSASKLGEEEFKELPVEKRSAISLARRLMDPLSELVKIDPKSIGVGQYQHDLDQKKLGEVLSGVVEDCVNSVGVNLNTASVSLLKYVSGINKSIANSIYDYRLAHGEFKNRKELLNVPKLGEKAFTQCAGFLRIIDGNEPLDNTSVHPESYPIAKEIIKETKIDLLTDDEETLKLKLSLFNKDKFLNAHKVGMLTLNDIIGELLKPGRDIRDDVKIVELDNSVKKIEDLKVGMILTGTVRNIADFGAFIDINVHQDGLVHISEISSKYIKHPSEILSINDIVKVKVISVDVPKKRIGLSIKQAK